MSSSDYFSKEARHARQQAREQREAEARHFHGRRYYAGVAFRELLTVFLRNDTVVDVLELYPSEDIRLLTRHAFKWADAMLAAEKESAK